MFGDGPSVLGTKVGDPLDYLDKIFQIPYSLPPMGRDGAAELVRALVEETAVAALDGAVRTPDEVAPDIPSDDPVVEEIIDAADGINGSGLGGRGMQLARNEQDLLAEVAAIVRTPRGVKKLVNLYRLVRVGPQAVADPKFAAPEVGAGNAVGLLAVS